MLGTEENPSWQKEANELRQQIAELLAAAKNPNPQLAELSGALEATRKELADLKATLPDSSKAAAQLAGLETALQSLTAQVTKLTPPTNPDADRGAPPVPATSQKSKRVWV